MLEILYMIIAMSGVRRYRASSRCVITPEEDLDQSGTRSRYLSGLVLGVEGDVMYENSPHFSALPGLHTTALYDIQIARDPSDRSQSASISEGLHQEVTGPVGNCSGNFEPWTWPYLLHVYAKMSTVPTAGRVHHRNSIQDGHRR